METPIQDVFVPTPLATPRKTSPTQGESGNPLRVLARIPWLTNHEPIESQATKAKSPTPLTHFEYLMGEFGLSYEARATAPHLDPPPRRSPIAPIETIALVDSSPPPVTAAEPKLTDFMLRLESAIEPYTRAIVLLLLLAVAAFTLLLLQPGDSEPLGTTEQTDISSTSVATMPADEPPVDSHVAKASQKKARRTPVEAQAKTEVERPNAKVATSEPPVATLSTEIQSPSSEKISASSEYPSVELPPRLITGLNESDASAPREARQRPEVTPAPPLQ